MDDSGSGGGGFVVLLMILVLLALYFTPTIIAFARGIADRGTVLVLNLFLGWTFVGWVVSLAMAARSRPDPVVVVAQPMIGQAGPQPGWYRDPSDPSAERWWDGARWSETQRALS
ncbi:superinfection immunity protein [Modestobacter sp. SYSU DS0511]